MSCFPPGKPLAGQGQGQGLIRGTVAMDSVAVVAGIRAGSGRGFPADAASSGGVVQLGDDGDGDEVG